MLHVWGSVGIPKYGEDRMRNDGVDISDRGEGRIWVLFRTL